ncbi:MAG TPA: glycine cleavage system aminomethyltransferase GcvT, partial [Methylococcaceae bacterium]|nr:glycine cleavage system aminomethyltransferase GcvT [Methylococcaceae bacterium]
MNPLTTPLNQTHKRLGARMVPFAGFEMPLHYGSQLAEHQRVRQAAGVFDVSHMMITDLSGAQSRSFLRHLLANDVARLESPGHALYSCMLNAEGGVVDDAIVYRLAADRFRLVSNAATRARVQDWLQQHAEESGVRIERRDDLAMLAVQGPKARAAADLVLGRLGFDEQALQALKPFTAVIQNDWLVARTGYTGEDGYEIMLPSAQAESFWQELLDAGVAPCG